MPDPPHITVVYAGKHVRIGWWTLLVFLTLGLGLEVMHGFKVGFYLNVSNETRRLMWTLAHAHGALLGLVHVVLGVYLRTFSDLDARNLPLASRCLVSASVLLPGGFFLGGVSFYSGDPGIGIVAVPVGAAALGVAVYFIARSTTRRPNGSRGAGRRSQESAVRNQQK